MLDSSTLSTTLSQNWPVWFVTVALVVAAVIDGYKLKVPNWLTFSLVISGWVFNTWSFGWEGLGYSLLGTLVGFALLWPLYAIGGMGAGDVKLLGGVGAWLGSTVTFYAFLITAVVGGAIALGMICYRGAWRKHFGQCWMIWNEIATIRNPDELAAIAAQRKSSMFLLPYGIPIAIGTIAYFAYTGMLL